MSLRKFQTLITDQILLVNVIIFDGRKLKVINIRKADL